MTTYSTKPRLRASCDGCFFAKVKCSKTRPICSRCLTVGLVCNYSPSSRTTVGGGGGGGGGSRPRSSRQLMASTLSDESCEELGRLLTSQQWQMGNSGAGMGFAAGGPAASFGSVGGGGGGGGTAMWQESSQLHGAVAGARVGHTAMYTHHGSINGSDNAGSLLGEPVSGNSWGPYHDMSMMPSYFGGSLTPSSTQAFSTPSDTWSDAFASSTSASPPSDAAHQHVAQNLRSQSWSDSSTTTDLTNWQVPACWPVYEEPTTSLDCEPSSRSANHHQSWDASNFHAPP